MASRAATLATTFVVAMLTVLACPTSRYPTTAFRCWPGGPEPRCPATHQCCSDDPAALDLGDLDGVALPAYKGRGGTGAPLFSAARNDSSHSGVCVARDSVSPADALTDAGVQGCQVPCNPQWDDASIEVVCGEGTLCCQTVEIDAADCVFDTALGDAGCWRPVDGDDIVGLDGLDATEWAVGEHATHQDPGLHGCEAFVAGIADSDLAAAGIGANELFQACLRRLGVANQRGFCIDGAIYCPLAQSSYRDACEQQNDEAGLAGCG